MKQPDVRAILRDIFRIISYGIYFSSHAILKTSDEIWFLFGENGGFDGSKLEKVRDNQGISRKTEFERRNRKK